MQFSSIIQFYTILSVINEYSSADNQKEVLKRMRQKFLESTKSSSEYEPTDVDRVKTNDVWIERFVTYNKDETEAVKALATTLKWRKSYGLENFSDEYFPTEIHKIGWIVEMGKDKDGRRLYFEQMNRFKRSDLNELIKRHWIYTVEKFDKQLSAAFNPGATFMAYFLNADLSNFDLELYLSKALMFQNHYLRPNMRILIVGMPPVIQTGFNLVLNGLTDTFRKLFIFTNSDEVRKYVSNSELPKEMNGTYDKPLRPIPESAKPLESFTPIRFTPQQIKQIRITFADILK